MKKLSTVFLCSLVLTIAPGCATNYQSDKLTKGYFTTHGYISVSSEKISEHEFRIVASGAAKSRVEDVEKVWTEFAQNVAAGRRYSRETKVEDFTYYDPVSYITFHAKRIVGKIVIEGA